LTGLHVRAGGETRHIDSAWRNPGSHQAEELDRGAPGVEQGHRVGAEIGHQVVRLAALGEEAPRIVEDHPDPRVGERSLVIRSEVTAGELECAPVEQHQVEPLDAVLEAEAKRSGLDAPEYEYPRRAFGEQHQLVGA
jgi:hypothetical protein